jgi:IclR family acetate operon transcriptional repressor
VKHPATRYRIVAVERAISVLEAFDSRSALSQAEVARAAGLSEATALRYLQTLASHGMIERESGSGRYRLGLRLFEFGERALVGRDARKVALPVMEDLLARFGETVNLAIRNGDALVLIEALESTRSIRKGAVVGGQDVWHASALGKSLLAALPGDEARELLGRRGLPRYTPHTITDAGTLLRGLARIRARGYAVDDQEAEPDLRCVGAAVFDRRGQARYAISVSGPAYRLTKRAIPEIGKEVERAAAEIAFRLGYAGERSR